MQVLKNGKPLVELKKEKQERMSPSLDHVHITTITPAGGNAERC